MTTRYEASVQQSELLIPVRTGSLAAALRLPVSARGVVLFAYGSGSSRHSPRNKGLAGQLNDVGYATMLLDLITIADDHRDPVVEYGRFDIPMLAARLVEAIDWLPSRERIGELPLGLFGASTGTAAALIAAAQRPQRVRAVVSRGGRPDLAQAELSGVRAPTLLIAGGNDPTVMELSHDAAATIGDHAQVMTISGANHLFSEPEAMKQVATHAIEWFDRHLGSVAPMEAATSRSAPRQGAR
jgi:pimeloyl-ACP methyl ester carboxylesterase